MRYETDELRKYYNRTKRGKAPVAYLTDLVKKTLDEWIKKDKGEGRFRQTGPYWEALYPILEKRAKAKLNAYAEIAGPFNTFNPRVRKEYEYDEELLNVVAAILKKKQREAAKTPTEQPHEIEIKGGAVLYTPNEKIGDKAKPKKIEADTKKKTVAVKGKSAPKKDDASKKDAPKKDDASKKDAPQKGQDAEFEKALKVALAKEKEGTLDDAIDLYSQLIKRKPDDERAYNLRGNVKALKEEFDEAVADYDEAIKLEPNYAEALKNRAVAKIKLDDFAGAEKDCDVAAPLAKDRNLIAAVFTMRANARFHQNNVEGAIEDFDMAIKADKKNPLAYKNRGVLKIMFGDKPGGCKDLEKAAELGNYAAFALMEKYCGGAEGEPS